MNHDGFGLGRPVDWSGNDLTDSLAIMQPIPKMHFDPLLDRRDPEFFSYLAEYERDIREAIESSGLDGFSKELKPSYYLVPPAAGPYSDFIFTLARDFNSVVDSIDAYVSLGSVLIPLILKRRRRDRADTEQSGARFWRTGSYVSLRMAEAMCLYDSHERYYDPHRHPRMTVESYSRGEHVGALDHPSQGTHYCIAVRIGRVEYVYIMSATCEVYEHFSFDGGKIIGLARPKWPENEDSYSVETVKYPSQGIDRT